VSIALKDASKDLGTFACDCIALRPTGSSVDERAWTGVREPLPNGQTRPQRRSLARWSLTFRHPGAVAGLTPYMVSAECRMSTGGVIVALRPGNLNYDRSSAHSLLIT